MIIAIQVAEGYTTSLPFQNSEIQAVNRVCVYTATTSVQMSISDDYWVFFKLSLQTLFLKDKVLWGLHTRDSFAALE